MNQTDPSKGFRPSLPDPAVGTVLAIAVIIELALILADLGLAGRSISRGFAYQYGGFWPGLLGDWDANYALQPWSMFLTYAFLHGGWLHLVVNMITLWSLGHAAIARVGRRGFVIVYLLSIIGGALGYAALWTAQVPMVGASGAISGVMGAYLVLYPRVRVHMLIFLGFFVTTAVVPAYLMLLYWAFLQVVGTLPSLGGGTQGGGVAFMAHLGGFVAGVALIKLFARPELLAAHRRQRRAIVGTFEDRSWR